MTKIEWFEFLGQSHHYSTHTRTLYFTAFSHAFKHKTTEKTVDKQITFHKCKLQIIIITTMKKKKWNKNNNKQRSNSPVNLLLPFGWPLVCWVCVLVRTQWTVADCGHFSTQRCQRVCVCVHNVALLIINFYSYLHFVWWFGADADDARSE